MTDSPFPDTSMLATDTTVPSSTNVYTAQDLCLIKLTLCSQIEIIVPGTMDVNILTDTSTHVRRISEQFTKMFGGATVSPNHYGSYELQADIDGLHTKGELILEPVTIISSNCTTADLKQHLADVYEICAEMKAQLNQECIAVRINGRMGFI